MSTSVKDGVKVIVVQVIRCVLIRLALTSAYVQKMNSRVVQVYANNEFN